MISVEEAHVFVRNEARALSAQPVGLAHALGLTLAEDVVSDVDSPPFDKSTVDGFAVAAEDPSTEFRIVGQVTAGQVPDCGLVFGETVELMTGTSLPAGASAVVKAEDCKRLSGGGVAIARELREAYANVLRRGASFQRGDVVLSRGKTLTPIGIGVLAELGRTTIAAHPRVRVGVLPTGDELAAPGEPLGVGQIYNSNGPMLSAMLCTWGADPHDLGIGRDDPMDLARRIEQGLQYDVLLISGGVSVGVKDLAPNILMGLGVRKVFHKVRMRPGKPLWFGVAESGARRTLVFGLPGNPVSALATAQLFVVPAIAALGGLDYEPRSSMPCRLSRRLIHRGDRPTYHPCRRVSSPREIPASGDFWVEPLAWQGSADLATLANADGWLVLPAGDYELEPGVEGAAIWFDRHLQTQDFIKPGRRTGAIDVAI